MRSIWHAPHGDQSVAVRRAIVRARKACGLCTAALVCLALTACGETITKHGHHFQDNDLQQVSSGMSQDQVRSTLGTPTTTATVGSATPTTTFPARRADLLLQADRKGPQGAGCLFQSDRVVDRVAKYGLKDGKVFNYAKRETPRHTARQGVLKALFRNSGPSNWASSNSFQPQRGARSTLAPGPTGDPSGSPIVQRESLDERDCASDATQCASTASSSSATMLVILIIGLTAGPAVSL